MITDNYIKMCEQAKQLQKLWKPKVGDYVWRKYTLFGEKIDSQIWSKDKMEEIIILTYASDIEGFFHATKDGETRIFNSNNEIHKKTCIYLPTQEQLQEMVITKEKKWYKVLSDFFRYINEKCHPSPEDFDKEEYSITYLWLAFVMKEKWNKVWLNGEWVKEVNNE